MIANRFGSVLNQDEDPFLQSYVSEIVEKMEMVQNAYTIRTNLQSPGGHTRKDINKECDFPETVNIGVREYKEKYDRNPIAARVVEAMPSECWNSAPLLFEDEDADVTTAFEEQWDELGKKFLGEESWYDGDQEGNLIWEYLARADKLSGIGHYGMILLGIDDGKPLHEPIDGFTDPNPEDTQPGPIYVNNADKPKRELLYISVFGEDSCQTGGIEFENNPHSPRYRKPKMYNIDLGDMNTTEGVTAGREERTVRVHWSRIVHIADNLNSSEVIGVPRMRPVWNNLLSLDKIYGADGEAFWKNCTPHTYFETNPQLGGDVSVDVDALRSSVWDMDNGLQKWMALMGMSAKTVAPQVVDPTAHINVHVEAICINLVMPVRIFKGSERGELASGQDDSTWNDQVRGRQNKYVIPRIIVPFINRLIQIGVLSPPKKVYKCEWPDPETLTPQEKADLALNRVDTMVKYIAGNVMQLMDPLDFLSREMDIDEDEAKGILERAAKAAEEEADKQAEEQMKLMKEQAKLNPPPQPGQPVPGKPGLPPVAGKPPGKQPPVPGKPVVPPAKPKGVPQPSLNEEGIENGSNPSSDLHKAGEWLSEQGLAMPGYGQIFLKENGSGEVWYVGGDGDEDGFATLVNKTLTKVEGIDEVTYESEGFPPRDGTWLQVYPEKQEWTENAFCPTGKGGGVDPTCGKGDNSSGTDQEEAFDFDKYMQGLKDEKSLHEKSKLAGMEKGLPKEIRTDTTDSARTTARERSESQLSKIHETYQKSTDTFLEKYERKDGFINPKESIKTIKKYTGDGFYEKINSSLREGKNPKDVPPKPHAEELQRMSSRKLKKPVVVYRGTGPNSSSRIMNSEVGSEIEMAGFVSTSFNPEVAARFAAGKGSVLEIKVKTGLYVGKYSKFNESELVQRHGVKYKYLGSEPGLVGGKAVNVIKLEEV